MDTKNRLTFKTVASPASQEKTFAARFKSGHDEIL